MTAGVRCVSVRHIIVCVSVIMASRCGILKLFELGYRPCVLAKIIVS